MTEVAEELSVSRQQVAKLRGKPDFPAPVAVLSLGEVWDLDAIRRWSESGLRRRRGRPSTEAPTVAVGRRFELIEEIGGGGFATVYAAHDLAATDGTQVAVKVLKSVHALDPEIISRFEQELKLMTGFSDPHVLSVIASGTDDRLGLWYAMPLAQGSLLDALKHQRTQDEVLEIMRQVCAGLSYVHAEGILHRDLKPENILRTSAGAWALADFGLARAVAETNVGLTTTAVAMGTAFYMAPEQWKDAKRVDERADVYSAGKVLQALLTRSTPVDDEVPAGAFRPVVLRAIAQDRRHRYDSATELLAAIEAVVGTPTGTGENAEEKGERLRGRLSSPRSVDEAAFAELVAWAEAADPDDYTEMGVLATTMSALSEDSVQWWWQRDAPGFRRVFSAFAERLCGSFSFGECDSLADFARRAVKATGDPVVLREAVRGLARLGEYHNRWHVRDVAVSVLQAIRTQEDAMAALEGLRAAGASASEWTLGETTRRTLHPVLRAGLPALLGP